MRFIHQLLPERIRFALFVFLKIYGNNQTSEKIRFALSGLLEDTSSDYKNALGEYLPVKNSTGGILMRHIAPGLELDKPNSKWLLVGEPKGTGSTVEKFIYESRGIQVEVSELETLLGVDWSSQEFKIDLCEPILENLNLNPPMDFDYMICQSLLEHVVNPVLVLLNLSLFLREGGILSISTHTPAMPIHRFPIDTLRYNQDFFDAVCKYIPFSLESVERVEHTIIATFKKRKLSA